MFPIKLGKYTALFQTVLPFTESKKTPTNQPPPPKKKNQPKTNQQKKEKARITQVSLSCVTNDHNVSFRYKAQCHTNTVTGRHFSNGAIMNSHYRRYTTITTGKVSEYVC